MLVTEILARFGMKRLLDTLPVTFAFVANI